MQQLTKEQAIIISAYTGVLACPFSDLHQFMEERLGRPVFTHEMGDPSFTEELRVATREDFLKLCY